MKIMEGNQTNSKFIRNEPPSSGPKVGREKVSKSETYKTNRINNKIVINLVEYFKNFF